MACRIQCEQVRTARAVRGAAFRPRPAPHRGVGGGAWRREDSLVNTVEIAGVDREDPKVARWVDRFSGHAVSPERAAEKILAGVAKKRYLIYTSQDIRALYAFKRLAWWPYSVAMRQVNTIFTRALRPAPPQLKR